MTKNKKVLIIDDEEDLVYAVTMQLEAEGYKVCAAFDGQAGWDQIRQEIPDIIILDLMLPKINGYKICRMIKFDRKYQKIPVIMFTARNQQEDEDLGFEVGADVYLTKPFDPHVLTKTIEKLLNNCKEKK